MPYRETEGFVHFLSKHIEGLEVPRLLHDREEGEQARSEARRVPDRIERSRDDRGRLLGHQGPQRRRLDQARLEGE